MKSTPLHVFVDGTILTSAPAGGGYVFLKEMLPRLSKRLEFKVELISPAPIPDSLRLEGVSIQQDRITGGNWFPKGQLRNLLGQIKRGLNTQINTLRSTPDQQAINFSIYYMPVPGQPQRKELSVIYDMIIEKFPEGIDPSYRKEFMEIKRKCFKRSTRFLAISHQTKHDLCEMTGVSKDQVDVAHLAYDRDVFYSEAQKQYANQPYILYVGGRLNHKNFTRFIKAYAQSHFKKDYRLKIAGYAWSPEESELIDKLGIRKLIEVEEKPSFERIAELYRKATCFVYPSLYEGFGLPLLESMASGCAVAAANAGSLPEIGKEAALYFNPQDESDIEKTIEKLLDLKTNQEFVEKGLERAKLFSWDKTTDAVAAAVLKTSKS